MSLPAGVRQMCRTPRHPPSSLRGRREWPERTALNTPLQTQPCPSRWPAVALPGPAVTPIDTGISVIKGPGFRPWASQPAPYLQKHCLAPWLRPSLTAKATINNHSAIFYTPSAALPGGPFGRPGPTVSTGQRRSAASDPGTELNSLHEPSLEK